MLRHAGEYFLYHTTDDGDRGVSVHRSTDLVHWAPAGVALEPGPPGHWAETDVWAPEVIARDGAFLMYVAGTRMGERGEGIEAARRQGLARSASPLGPFVWDDAPLVSDTWSIDGHPFTDADGADWLFYNVRTPDTGRNGRPGSANVVDRLVAPDRLAGDPVPVVTPSADWEASLDGAAYWNEGAWTLRRRGAYHQLYSGGFYREASYAVGVASAPNVRGPWHKHPANPLLRSGERITGPGHLSVTVAPDGVTPYAVYHGYDGGRPGRKVHVDRLYWRGDRPQIGLDPAGRPTEAAQPVPPGPVHDPAVPTWHLEAWVDDGAVRLAGIDLPLDSGPGPRHLRAEQGPGGLRAWVDGALRVQAPGAHVPSLDGAIRASALTSHLADEAVHRLAPGERHAWAWGGEGPLELILAVRGHGEVRAGEAEAAFASPDDHALVRLTAPTGARQLEVVAGPGGAEATDLFAAARADAGERLALQP